MTSQTDVVIRRSAEADLAAVVNLLVDDEIGATRESPDDLTPYRAAFALIDSDPHQLLVVAERDGDIIGTMQLTLIPGLSRKGSSRMIIEAVRVAAGERGKSLGGSFMQWAENQARTWGCQLVQLTSDKTRKDAHRFYQRLGYVASHEGFKKNL